MRHKELLVRAFVMLAKDMLKEGYSVRQVYDLVDVADAQVRGGFKR